ncbi:MAG TPA: hypothetical protein VFG28_15410, partial [Syntrophales bacterium]|nr:hypothetical protein [Syntrophales bacterium]
GSPGILAARSPIWEEVMSVLALINILPVMICASPLGLARSLFFRCHLNRIGSRKKSVTV